MNSNRISILHTLYFVEIFVYKITPLSFLLDGIYRFSQLLSELFSIISIIISKGVYHDTLL